MNEQFLKHLKMTGPEMTQTQRSRVYLATTEEFDQGFVNPAEHASSRAIR